MDITRKKNKATLSNGNYVAKVLASKKGIALSVLINGNEFPVNYCADSLGYVSDNSLLFCTVIDGQLIGQSIIKKTTEHQPVVNCRYQAHNDSVSLRFQGAEMALGKQGVHLTHQAGKFVLANSELQLQGKAMQLYAETLIDIRTDIASGQHGESNHG